MKATLAVVLPGILLGGALFASDESPGSNKGPSVTMSPAVLTTVTRGKPGLVPLDFRVVKGFHINSNRPNAEFLIPTVLSIEAPTDIVVGKVTYPPGEDISLPFAPTDKLNVYTGDFQLTVLVRPLVGVAASKYMLHGRLKYQACDNAACYPPKSLPVEFEIKVIKGPAAHVKNPGQSPHVHN
ncbi:MAG: disulfide bond formation protein DsbC [Acidobacteriales bacterium]|nr:disulfide bond formation protein DsbC [Terriglobales bacterium]